jgi:hypothetical protein
MCEMHVERTLVEHGEGGQERDRKRDRRGRSDHLTDMLLSLDGLRNYPVTYGVEVMYSCQRNRAMPY